ncbi:hypothetical protein [Actinoplanes sp. HUAS TT8]|uniref:hypothetical protein n=1 Tax=Actinoplanes sp. HUAS TT8 TaxID=3447453 RepID=UPI003F527F33
MRRITTFGLVTALIAAFGTPAVAGPPTAEQLQGALLTAAEVPAGYVLDGPPRTETRQFGYGRPCDDDDGNGPEVPEVTAVEQSYDLDSIRSVEITLAAPGSHSAREFVRGLADRAVRCPHDYLGMYDVDKSYTGLPLPALGDAAAGLATVINGQVSGSDDVTPMPPSHELSAAVAVGDLVAFFDMTNPATADVAVFVELVSRSAAKLVRVKDRFPAG